MNNKNKGKKILPSEEKQKQALTGKQSDLLEDQDDIVSVQR